MLNFHYTPDPSSPYRFTIRDLALDVEHCFTPEQGIHLCQTVLTKGVLGCTADLWHLPSSKMDLTGTLVIARATLTGSKESLGGSFQGHFIVREYHTAAEVVVTEFTWDRHGNLWPTRVCFAPDETILRSYFNDSSQDLPTNLHVVLSQFVNELSNLFPGLLAQSGWFGSPVPGPVLADIEYVETRWDVLD